MMQETSFITTGTVRVFFVVNKDLISEEGVEGSDIFLANAKKTTAILSQR